MDTEEANYIAFLMDAIDYTDNEEVIGDWWKYKEDEEEVEEYDEDEDEVDEYW